MVTHSRPRRPVGRPPKGRTRQCSYRLLPDTVRSLKRTAQRVGTSATELLEFIINAYTSL